MLALCWDCNLCNAPLHSLLDTVFTLTLITLISNIRTNGSYQFYNSYAEQKCNGMTFKIINYSRITMMLITICGHHCWMTNDDKYFLNSSKFSCYPSLTLRSPRTWQKIISKLYGQWKWVWAWSEHICGGIHLKQIKNSNSHNISLTLNLH